MKFAELALKNAILDLMDEGYGKEAIMKAMDESHPAFMERIAQWNEAFETLARGEEYNGPA